jgi:ketosteroid isomerase-like protein
MAEASRAHEAPEEGMSASATLFTCWLIAFATPAWAGAAADVGAAAYRKDWQTFLGTFDGPITVELADVGVVADRNLAYSRRIQHIAGNDKQGKKLDRTVRVTEVYKKMRGRWQIIHEHVSVPVDLATDEPISAPSRSSSH